MELAVAAPLILLVGLGSFYLANMARQKALVSRLALEAGRLAVVKSRDEVQTYINQIVAKSDFSLSSVKVKIAEADKQDFGDLAVKPVKVTVSCRYLVSQVFGWSPSIVFEKSYIFDRWEAEPVFNFY